MMSLRTQLNPAFKIAQPLPKLTGDLTAIRRCVGPYFIPALPRSTAGGLMFSAAGPDRRPSGEGGKPRP
jgi:hypothetical protein